MTTKVVAIVFHVDEDNEDDARKQIEVIINTAKQNPIFRDVGLDQKYADQNDLLLDRDTDIPTIN